MPAIANDELVGPIQAVPYGLLALLSLKQLGQNPNALGAQVSPGIDLRDWYLQTQVEYVAGQVPLLSADRFALGVTIPAGEIWFIHSIGGESNLGAAEDVDCIFGYLPQGFDVVIPFQETISPLNRAATVPNARYPFGCVVNQFLDSSCQLFTVCRHVTGTVDIEWCIRFTRMRR